MMGGWRVESAEAVGVELGFVGVWVGGAEDVDSTAVAECVRCNV